MINKLNDRRFFAVIAFVFAATTWLNWTAPSAAEQTHLPTVATITVQK